MMSKKENALRILRFDKPEYVMSEIPSFMIDYKGCNHEGYEGGGHDCDVGSKWTDIWGVEWHKEHDDVMGFPRGNPLSDMDNLKAYKWPDPNDERICAQIYKRKEAYKNEDLFITGSHRDTLWEKSYMLVGMDDMMVYLYTEPEYAREILHRIMDFQLGIAEHYIKLGVETVNMSDDLGTQNSLLMGIDLLYEFFVPEYKRLFDLYKKHGVIVNFHSCGHIEPVIGMFMELGVDCLNPVQVTANNIVKVREATMGKIALTGGVSNVIVMNGDEKEIESAVRDTIRLLGKNGGYFCQPDQYMPFSDRSIEVFDEAVAKYGVYPVL